MEMLQVSLARPFKNDRFVDLSLRTVLPGKEVIDNIGDLSDPSSITFSKAIKCFGEAIRTIGINRTSGGPTALMDETYAIDAFNFVSDNLSQKDCPDEEQREALKSLKSLLNGYIKSFSKEELN